ncbi:hypothetical protein BC629DRAFT_1295998 [Irpex lacteus]|nr:hypothetical protein BC629DRAFT_1295998 [Irpex lacteus]
MERVSKDEVEDITLYYPFASRLDWQIAHWGSTHSGCQVRRQKLNLSFKNYHNLERSLSEISQRAGKWYTRGLKFPDVPDEIYLLRMRDPVEAIRSLWGDPTLAKHLQVVYRPQKVFTNSTKTNRLYSEMWSGTWWYAAQARLPPGATLAPLIIATDKTHLTNFSGGKQAYPVYLTGPCRHLPNTTPIPEVPETV